MKTWTILFSLSTAALAACSQTQDLGDETQDLGAGSGGGTSTTSAGGATGEGGAYEPCEGKACGDACTLCSPNDPDCVETAVLKVCDSTGTCVDDAVDCGPGTCLHEGKTYLAGESFPSSDACNDCACQQDGTVICTQLACAPCGGIAALKCDPGTYCNWGDTCGISDTLGVCAAIPEACADVFNPVCGCDNQTYGNACTAAAAGVSIAHEFACAQKVCGGFSGTVCDDPDEYCQFVDGTCDFADDTGACMPVPSECTQEYDPVCGCDGETYGNRCEAARSGTSVHHAGEC